jgi:hypothetical protein
MELQAGESASALAMKLAASAREAEVKDNRAVRKLAAMQQRRNV